MSLIREYYMPIKVLDSATIDQIAAGEVVERPSSIVKELVENSIDAHATAITVEIKNGGIDYIRVTDNGSGIKSNEIRTAFLRHATSKIASAEDLGNVRSLGFRGEALSSIAAVTKFEIVTKTDDSLVGTRMTLDGAVETGFEEIGAPTGTTMIARNIFFNTPVRKKFLKSGITEASYISDLMEHLALSHPDVSIQYTINSQTRFHTSGNGDLKEVIYRVYGREVANAIVPINVTKDGITIRGFLGKPEQVRSNRNFEIYFINGRFIRSNLIARAVEEGFREYLMLHKFPICFLHITVDPENVDVNVHPTKMDVRFADGPSFFAALSSSISTTLKANEMIPGHVLDKQRDILKEEKQGLEEARQGKNPEPFEISRLSPVVAEKKFEYTAANSAISPSANTVERPAVNTVTKPNENTVKNQSVNPVTLTDNSNLDSVGGETEDFFEDNTPQIQPVIASENYILKHKDNITENAESGNPCNEDSLSQTKEESDNIVNTPVDNSEEIVSDIVTCNQFSENNNIEDKSTPEIKVLNQTDLFEDKILSRSSRAKYRIIGQVFETFWIIQYERKMFIIDQHAAHEKVNYERMMKRFREKQIVSQTLLPPIIVSLSGREESVYKDNAQAFANLGYEIEHFGGNEYALRGVPVDLYGNDEKELFLAVLDELAEGNSRGSYLVIEEKIANMACKASVKGGDKLSMAEVEELIDELLGLENPYNCPHGRPTIIVMTETEMEKKFKRIVD